MNQKRLAGLPSLLPFFHSFAVGCFAIQTSVVKFASQLHAREFDLVRVCAMGLPLLVQPQAVLVELDPRRQRYPARISGATYATR